MKKTKSAYKINKVNTFKIIWNVATVKQKVHFFVLLFIGIIAAMAILVPTQIISIIVSRLSGETVSVFGIVIPDTTSYVTIILVGAAITYLMRLIRLYYDLEIEKLLKRVIANLRCESFKWLLEPRKNMDLKMTQGDAVYRLNQAPDLVTNVIVDFFSEIIPDVLTAIIAFVYIISLDLTSTIFVIAGVLLVILCVIIRAKIEKHISFKTERAKSALSSMVANSITNLPLINLYRSMAYESSIFNVKVDNHYQQQKKQINLRILYWTFVRFIQISVTFVVIYFCAKQIYAKTMSVGNIVIISNYVAQIFTPIQTIGYFAAKWINCSVALNRLYELKPEQKQLLPLKSKNEEIKSLELVHVCKDDGSSLKIDNINAKFEKGKLTVVTGESGCGKSTLIKLICGLNEKTSGDIILNEKTKLYSSYLISNNMSVAMQDAYIFNRDVKMNILYPDGNISKEEYEPIVNKLTLDKVFDREYNEMGELNLENMLSGGERKRIGLARAFIKKADLYIFDEPTNDLDNKNAKKVIQTIEDLKNDAIVIVVTHDDRVKKIADQTLIFSERGKLKKVNNETV